MPTKNYYKKLTQTKFEQVIVNGSPTPKVVVFNSSWLGLGQMLDEVVSELSKNFTDKFEFFRVEIDQDRQLIQEYGLNEIPAIVLFQDSQIVFCHAGIISFSKLKKLLSGFDELPD